MLRRAGYTALLLSLVVVFATSSTVLATVVPMHDCGHEHGCCWRCALWYWRHGHHGTAPASDQEDGHDHMAAAAPQATARASHQGHGAAPECVEALCCNHLALDALAAQKAPARLGTPATTPAELTPVAAASPHIPRAVQIEAFPPPSPPPRRSL